MKIKEISRTADFVYYQLWIKVFYKKKKLWIKVVGLQHEEERVNYGDFLKCYIERLK